VSFAKTPVRTLGKKGKAFIDGAEPELQEEKTVTPLRGKPWAKLDPKSKKGKTGYSIRLNPYWAAILEKFAEDEGRSKGSILEDYVFKGLAKDAGVSYKSKRSKR